MTPEELQEAIAELKAQGASEEDIAAAFYVMFSEGKIDIKEFGALLEAIDFEFVEGFLDLDEETQKTIALRDDKDAPPSESNEGDNNPAPQREGENDKSTSSNDDKDESNDSPKEDKEEDKAMRLFGK